jgi:hypothetical protein
MKPPGTKRSHNTGGGDVAAPLQLGRVLLCARHGERRLCAEGQSDDREHREQQPAHATSL